MVPDSAIDPKRNFGALAAQLSEAPARLRLATLPTPVERASWLDGPHSEVWIKRDDLSSPVYGGSKVRKLEWILANPPFHGREPIVSMGGIGSHHLLALALFLREQGRELHALMFETRPTPHILEDLAVMVSIGVNMWHVKTRAALPWAMARYYALARPQRIGRYMAAGASTALGCLGFVEAAFELAQQIKAGEVPRPDRIYITGGSAGTSAGLTLGLALAGVRTHVHIVSSVERWAFNDWLFRNKMNAAWTLLRAHGMAGPRRVETLLRSNGVTYAIDAEHVGAGYGEPTAEAEEAVALGAAHGLALETTYTAKCVAALRRQEREQKGTALFWTTHAGNDLSSLIDPSWRERCPFRVARSEP